MHADIHTPANTDTASTQTRTAALVGIFHHSPLKRGCPVSVISGTSTWYTSSEKPGRHGGVPLPSAAICDSHGGREGERKEVGGSNES